MTTAICCAVMNVSIVIPTVNEAARIVETVRSAQATGPHEVIVVDGGSSDETVLLARDCDCRVFESSRGRAAQQNVGAARSSGDVLLFLHADCRLEPGSLEQIADALADPTIGGGAFRQRIEADGWLYRLLEAGNAARVKWLRMAYGDQGIFVRRALFKEIGGFPEIRLMEDVRLMRRLRRRTRLVLLPGPLYVCARRWQRHGVVRQTARNWMLLTLERLGVSADRLADFYRPHWQEGESKRAEGTLSGKPSS